MTTATATSSPVLVYQQERMALYQCDRTESLVLTIAEEEICFRVCELIAFRRRVQQINVVDLLASDTPDIEVVNLLHCDRLFVFSIHEVLQLKELLAGSFVMLELNSIIHRTILRKRS